MAPGKRAALVLAVLGLDLALVWACEKDEAKPPRLNCAPSCPTSPPMGVGGTGGTGSVPDTGVADVAADATTTVSGTVQAFAAEDFVATVPLLAQAEVRGETPAGGEVSANWDGSNPFQLDGVRLGRDVWFSVLPSLSPVEVMPTLLQADTATGQALGLPLVRGGTLDTIFSALTAPTTRAAGTGQVVLRFVNDAEPPVPVAGVQLTLPFAEVVAYDNAGTFSDVVPGTGPLGLAIAANVPAGVPLPGTDHPASISGAFTGSVKIRIAADAATFLQVRLSR